MGILEKTVSITGRFVAWLTLVMVLLTFAIVVLRYGFDLGWIWLQESVTYMHAMVFLLAAAWTLQQGGHVRVDIFYRNGSEKHQAMVNIAGTVLFLMPLCIFLILVAWEYVFSSWQVLEKSREAGGLPLVFALKSLIILFPVLLLMQAVPDLIKSISLVRRPELHKPGENSSSA